MTKQINASDDILDSRDIDARIEELESEISAIEEEVSEDHAEQVTEIEEQEERIAELDAELAALFKEIAENPEQEEVLTARKTEIEDRIEQLMETLADTKEESEEEHCQSEVLEELKKELSLLTTFRDDVNSAEWKYGLTLINENYFQKYTEEMVEELYGKDAVPNFLVIDWEATVDNVKIDYSCVEFDGETFYYRD